MLYFLLFVVSLLGWFYYIIAYIKNQCNNFWYLWNIYDIALTFIISKTKKHFLIWESASLYVLLEQNSDIDFCWFHAEITIKFFI